VDPVTVERRLAAVLAADIVGYSRLVEADEAGTLAAIKMLHSNVIGPLLSRLRGRLFHCIHAVIPSVEPDVRPGVTGPRRYYCRETPEAEEECASFATEVERVLCRQSC
jgi:class 3 adenylate cyclase